MSTLRIALAQLNPTVGDLDGNVARIAEAIGAARDAGADLVITPELALCGYPPEDLLLKPSFLRDCYQALEALGEHTRGITAVIGFPDAERGAVYNAAALVSSGTLVSVYHKVELPNYGVFDERRYFEPGTGYLLFELNGVRTFVTICEDVWIDGGPTERSARKNHTSLVINLSASPFHAGKCQTRAAILSRLARRTAAFVCYCNLVGGQDELVFDGGSLILSPAGTLIASARRFDEDLLIADVRLDTHGGETAPRQVNGRWERRISLTSRNSRGRQPLPPSVAPELDPLDEVHQALVLGTRDYLRKNGFTKAVVGLSGGIDSALTAALAVEALGPDNVVTVTMPSPYTSESTRTDAARLAASLGVPMLTVPIKPVYRAYLDALDAYPPAPAPKKDSRSLFRADPGRATTYDENVKKTPEVFSGGVTGENIQARIRGNVLMALSNRFGWLVLTTGNKSELATGYCTLYGDMAGGFAVIKDVPKTLVYRLARRLNERAARKVIPQSILDRAPSAELRPDQRDEDSLPPYAALDPVLEAYVEGDMGFAEIVEAGHDPDLVREVIRLVDGAEYKRRQAPPGVKITPKAFGRDRRLPITNRYREGDGQGAKAGPKRKGKSTNTRV
ncbi:MAG: NAD(+) synthase [Planctomycetota bacterium]